MGGYTTGRKEIIEMLRQRSRPYLFSNSLTPAIVGASIKVIDLLSGSTDLRDRLEKNVDRFRTGIEKLGFKTRGSGAAIVPVMLGDAKLSQVMADKLVNGAESAAEAAATMAQASGDTLAILVSCVGRKLVMGDRVDEEVEAVSEVFGTAGILTGFYSYGEISPFTPGASCKLHNQTMTITCLSEI